MNYEQCNVMCTRKNVKGCCLVPSNENHMKKGGLGGFHSG